ncbi:hypothetical protein D046_2048A, partial [Vibrio parahaemolyticus V-223/04]|jgi:hypothetical protein
MQG